MNQVLRAARAVSLGFWDTFGDWGGEFTWLLKSPIKERIRVIAPEEPFLYRRLRKTHREPSPVWENYREQKPRIIKGKPLNLAKLAKYRGENLSLEDWPQNEEPAIVDFALDEHQANRAGLHYDLRFRHPDNGIVLSLALRKGLPSLGKPHLGKDVTGGHGGISLTNPPVIPDGYGAGTTKNLFDGKGAIWKQGDHWKILFHGEGFSLIPTKEGFLVSRWKDSPKGGQTVPHRDRPWKSKDLTGDKIKLEALIQNPDIIFERKYDGAQYRLQILEDGHTRLISRKPEIRNGQPTGNGIDKSWQILPLKQNKEALSKWKGWEFAVEVYSEAKGNNGTSHGYLTTILNSDPVSSWEIQDQFGWARIKLLAPTKYPDRIKTYQDWMTAREEIHKDLPFLRIPTTAITPNAKANLVERLRGAEEEGVVAKNLKEPVDGNVWKFKFLQTFDRKFMGFAKSQTGREEVGTALFLTPKGEMSPTQGITLELAHHFGFEGVKELRTAIWNNPGKFGLKKEGDRLLDIKGDTTLVLEGLGEFEESGKIRVPVIREVHLDK